MTTLTPVAGKCTAAHAAFLHGVVVDHRRVGGGSIHRMLLVPGQVGSVMLLQQAVDRVDREMVLLRGSRQHYKAFIHAIFDFD